MDPAGWKVDLQAVMEPVAAAKLYAECLRVTGQLDAIFSEVTSMVDKLEKGIVMPVAMQLADQISARRSILSAQLAQRWRAELSRLRRGVGVAQKLLSARMASGVFPVAAFLDDLQPLEFLEPFIALLEVDRSRLSGRLLDLLHSTLAEQLEQFDDTTHTPEKKLAGTPFAARIKSYDCTPHDLFCDEKADTYRPHFEPLIRRLEQIEKRYASSRAQRDLLDLLFTLLAQDPTVAEFIAKWSTAATWADRTFGWESQVLNWLGAATGHRLVTLVQRLAHTIRTYGDLLHERNVGALVVARQELPPKRSTDPEVGSLNHFMRVSHSVSRDDLYPEVRAALMEQLSPPRQRGRGR
jgi:hypothetical protein